MGPIIMLQITPSLFSYTFRSSLFIQFSVKLDRLNSHKFDRTSLIFCNLKSHVTPIGLDIFLTLCLGMDNDTHLWYPWLALIQYSDSRRKCKKSVVSILQLPMKIFHCRYLENITSFMQKKGWECLLTIVKSQTKEKKVLFL